MKHHAEQLELFEVPRALLPRRDRNFPFLVVEASTPPALAGGAFRAILGGSGESKVGRETPFDTPSSEWATDSTRTSAG